MLFSHPAFLWGLLAVAIPIIVHLFNFRRYRKVYFSNVDRLNEMQHEQRRHSTLRQWLVLAARILAIVMLVFAFAQPVIPSSNATVRTGSTAVSIYVDNSFSMGNATGDGTLLDAARQKVHEVADAYSVSDRFQLITNDMKGSEMRWLNRDELFAALDDLEVSPAAPLMSTVMERQRDFLQQSGAHNWHAYLISDFQLTTADLDALPSDSSLLVTLVPLSAVESDNLFIDSIVLDAPAYFSGGSVSVEATLRNSGSHDVEKVPVKLLVDGRERALATVDIAADATAKVTLRFTLEHTGWVDGYVTIEDYPITFDDNYYFTFHVGDRIKMLEIDGHEANSHLTRLFKGDSSVDLRQERMLQHDLSDYDFVILNEPKALTSGEVQQLTQWVGEGGSLLVIPSDGGASDLNALLGALQAPQLDRWVQRPVKANSVDYGSMLYRGVFNGRNDEMEMPSVQGHYMLGHGQALKQSIITLADGGDLLTLTPAGQGRLYLFTTPLNANITDLVSQALFVPTLYNMALYSRPLPPVSHTLGDPEPIALQGSYDPNARPPELTDGGKFSLLPDLRRIAGRWQMIPHGEVSTDGIFSLGDEHLAFNYPRRESTMTFLDRNAIAKAIDGREGYSIVRSSAKPLTEELRARDGGHPLWRLCLVLTLLALAAEIILLKTNYSPTPHPLPEEGTERGDHEIDATNRPHQQGFRRPSRAHRRHLRR